MGEGFNVQGYTLESDVAATRGRAMMFSLENFGQDRDRASHIPASPGYLLSEAQGPDDGWMQARLPQLSLRACYQDTCCTCVLSRDNMVSL